MKCPSASLFPLHASTFLLFSCCQRPGMKSFPLCCWPLPEPHAWGQLRQETSVQCNSQRAGSHRAVPHGRRTRCGDCCECRCSHFHAWNIAVLDVQMVLINILTNQINGYCRSHRPILSGQRTPILCPTLFPFPLLHHKANSIIFCLKYVFWAEIVAWQCWEKI